MRNHRSNKKFKNSPERELTLRKLQHARNIATPLNWLGAGVTIWLWFFPRPYAVAILVAAVVPLVGIFVVRSSGGFVRADSIPNSSFPHVIAAIFLPPSALVFRSLFDFELLHYSKIWLPASFLTVLLCCCLLVKNTEFTYRSTGDFLTIFIVPLVFFAYSFAMVNFVNVLPDKSDIQFFSSKVLAKTKKRGRRKPLPYEIKLSPWGPQKQAVAVSISREFYNRIKVGDEVSIKLRSGSLDIPYYVIDE